MLFICQKHFLFGKFEVNFHVLTPLYCLFYFRHIVFQLTAKQIEYEGEV